MNPDSHTDPDDYQQAWQAHSSQTRVTIDADLLLKELHRDQRCFRAVIFWGDVFAVGIALLMLPAWIYMGVTLESPWTWYLTAPVLVWNVVFTLVYRMRRRQKPGEPSEPLLHCVKESLTQVEEQVWLTRRCFWWDTLPLCISMLASIAHLSWLKARDWWDALTDVNALVFVCFLALLYFVYYLKRRAAAVDCGWGFAARRQELLTLIASLRDESTGELERDE